MLSEETLKKFFDAVYGLPEGYQLTGEEKFRYNTLWLRFLAHKNILDEYCVQLVKKRLIIMWPFKTTDLGKIILKVRPLQNIKILGKRQLFAI